MPTSDAFVPTTAKVVTLSAPTIRCGGCVAAIERALASIPDVDSARVNLTMRRISLTPAGGAADLSTVFAELERIGHPATPIDATEVAAEIEDKTAQALLRAVAVAGFGTMNVMLLSVAVWSGASGATRDTFHIISGLIAVPIVVYAGRFFFTSAWSALRRGRMNMDVPIALAIALATGLSLFETARGGEQVFFDAAVTLTFFLLIGRYLDHRMRDRARSAMTGLSRLAMRKAVVVAPSGSLRDIPVDQVVPGMMLRIAAGERIPVDVRIVAGTTDLDRALVTGESRPVLVCAGCEVEAGALNLTGPVDAVALRPVSDSFLARMMGMLATAEEGRGRYVRIADRAARFYAPVIHLLALATFVGWLSLTGDWQRAAFVAISVLIVTCPCALALAVPVAHVVAAGRLMADGILMKDGSALERLAGVDHVAWDKTGTLTTGDPTITSLPELDPTSELAVAALAARSAHPAARCIASRLASLGNAAVDVLESPGLGIEGVTAGRRARLGRASWVAEIATGPADGEGPAFAFEGGEMVRFPLSEKLRDGAPEAFEELARMNLPVEILSGDEPGAVGRIAGRLSFVQARAAMSPSDKIARLQVLRAEGHRVLMVGDGLNDTAALATAHVSMSPASASDAGRAAADLVFLRDDLRAVPQAIAVARRTSRIVRQNFGLAILYNCIAVPLAVAGLVTPLIAAIAMSASSLAVVANSLRLNRRDAQAPAPTVSHFEEAAA
ncbi:cadmium-translocating P-type ATPase [Paracoccus sp. TK19116]|uniref:Cadmium-translocating P-type ATPase n=1 Tax=Paracoccus albicereus TaxID=2922394 RepID=A0ABT1MXI0_9RHOB|nr:heavy metal translocating P-type ATPase [Paracoccus albicereus]MCQ0972216.1 cadmium-translocating P-type ATPase [Paracoccus albicereus]